MTLPPRARVEVASVKVWEIHPVTSIEVFDERRSSCVALPH
jgi:hypothetical protein